MGTGLTYAFLVITAFFLLQKNLINPITKILKELKESGRITSPTNIVEFDTLSDTINFAIASVEQIHEKLLLFSTY